jgi:hypothetical protein
LMSDFDHHIYIGNHRIPEFYEIPCHFGAL